MRFALLTIATQLIAAPFVIAPLTAVLLMAWPAVSAHAQGSVPVPLTPLPRPAVPRPLAAVGQVMSLEAGSGRVFGTSRPITNLFVADPKVAEARPASPNSVFVFGVGAGRMTVAALDEAGNVLSQYDVVVCPSAFGANEAAAAVRRPLPGSDVRMSATPDGMTATGTPATPVEAERIAAAARAYLGKDQKFDNNTTLNTSVQMTLRVRIAEISRDITRQLGIN